MSTYLIFFGKSQDFTAQFYDRNNPIDDFNSVIKDFDLLESKIFTVDDIKNKEILSRYCFTTQGKSFCLLKLYSFAQAFNGNRIAGSIYGVALLSEKLIDFTKDNLELLRAAKDNFAKLSLDGAKFNKSNFKEDTDRIWKAIITNSNGNLLDLINATTLKINKTTGQLAFFVKNLFEDSIKLNPRISNQDIVYLSEDLEHLKRTQNKWGKDNFPVYWEQNNHYVIYKEPEIIKQHESRESPDSKTSELISNNDIGKLKAELEDYKYKNRNLNLDLEKIKDKHKTLYYFIYALSGVVVLLLFYLIFFSNKDKEGPITQNTTTNKPQPTIIQSSDLFSNYLLDSKSVDSALFFLNACKYIYAFDIKKSFTDSLNFKKMFTVLEKEAIKKNLNIENIKNVYKSKISELNHLNIVKQEKDIPAQTSPKNETKKANSN
jgi:hypothetical protein